MIAALAIPFSENWHPFYPNIEGNKQPLATNPNPTPIPPLLFSYLYPRTCHPSYPHINPIPIPPLLIFFFPIFILGPAIHHFEQIGQIWGWFWLVPFFWTGFFEFLSINKVGHDSTPFSLSLVNSTLLPLLPLLPSFLPPFTLLSEHIFPSPFILKPMYPLPPPPLTHYLPPLPLLPALITSLPLLPSPP